MQKVESFLQTAAGNPRFAGGAFDYVSVCPPYDKVSYAELLAALEASPLVREGTTLVVEYPLRESEAVADTLGRLRKARPPPQQQRSRGACGAGSPAQTRARTGCTGARQALRPHVRRHLRGGRAAAAGRGGGGAGGALTRRKAITMIEVL